MAKSATLGKMNFSNRQLGIALIVCLALVFTPVYWLGKLGVLLVAILLLMKN